jgi:hypothetical protein
VQRQFQQFEKSADGSVGLDAFRRGMARNGIHISDADVADLLTVTGLPDSTVSLDIADFHKIAHVSEAGGAWTNGVPADIDAEQEAEGGGGLGRGWGHTPRKTSVDDREYRHKNDEAGVGSLFEEIPPTPRGALGDRDGALFESPAPSDARLPISGRRGGVPTCNVDHIFEDKILVYDAPNASTRSIGGPSKHQDAAYVFGPGGRKGSRARPAHASEAMAAMHPDGGGGGGLEEERGARPSTPPMATTEVAAAGMPITREEGVQVLRMRGPTPRSAKRPSAQTNRMISWEDQAGGGRAGGGAETPAAAVAGGARAEQREAGGVESGHMAESSKKMYGRNLRHSGIFDNLEYPVTQ